MDLVNQKDQIPKVLSLFISYLDNYKDSKDYLIIASADNKRIGTEKKVFFTYGDNLDKLLHDYYDFHISILSDITIDLIDVLTLLDVAPFRIYIQKYNIFKRFMLLNKDIRLHEVLFMIILCETMSLIFFKLAISAYNKGENFCFDISASIVFLLFTAIFIYSLDLSPFHSCKKVERGKAKRKDN